MGYSNGNHFIIFKMWNIGRINGKSQSCNLYFVINFLYILETAVLWAGHTVLFLMHWVIVEAFLREINLKYHLNKKTSFVSIYILT